MKRTANWIAASIFFLAGSLLYAVPTMARSVLYAARMTGPSWQVPDPTVEGLVPKWPSTVGFFAYLLCVVALGWPQLSQWVNAYFAVPVSGQAIMESEPPAS